MNPIDRQTLARKLDYLRKQLALLETYRALPIEELLANHEKRCTVERLLEVSIQAVIDIARLLVALKDWRRPGDERDALDLLVERGFLAAALAGRLYKAKGFRNILVHEYVEVDPALLAKHLRDDLDDLWAFARCIAAQLA